MVLLGKASLRGYHDACIVPEHVEPVFSVEELFHAAFYAAEVGEVEFEEVEGSARVRVLGLEAVDGVSALFGRAGGDVDCCVALIEKAGEESAYAACGTCYDEDLGDVFSWGMFWGVL